MKVNWKDKENLISIVKQCTCYADVLRTLGLGTNGSNPKTLKKYISLYNIDVSHFDANVNRSIKSSLKAKDISNYLKENSYVSSSLRKQLIKRPDLLEYKCAICGLSSWLGKPISLQLDHIDGNRKHNMLSNLRWLCPNCHSQTDTFAGRNK